MATTPIVPHDGVADTAIARSLGVICQTTEIYSVGTYRYTNINDAIAQARRMIALEDDLR